DDHAEAGSHHRLIVGEQHPYRLVAHDPPASGSVACTTHTSPAAPAANVPPRASTRSRMPTSPYPQPADGPAAPGSRRFWTSITTDPAVRLIETVTGASGSPYLRTLVVAS